MFNIVEGKKVQNHIMYKMTAESLEECTVQCVTDDKCQSVNYFHMTRTCDVNKYSASVAPSDLTSDTMSQYVERKIT